MATAIRRSESLMTVEEPSTRALNLEREQEWETFCRALKAWEWHLLAKGDLEMVCHDGFIAGEITLEAVRLMVSFNLDENISEPE